MNVLTAAATILQEANEPLHYQEITQRIIAHGLWQPKGKTPDATVNARLAVDIKDNQDKSLFYRQKAAVFGLREWLAAATLEPVSSPATKEQTAKEPPLPVPEQTPLAKPTKKVPASTKTMSFTDAAATILDTFANKQPMHYRAITDKILELGLVNTQGQTPEATLYAQILTEISRNTKRGEVPRFVKHGRGLVGLQKWAGEEDDLVRLIEKHNEEVKKELHARLHNMLPKEFEALVAQLLVALGFEDVTVTKISHDGGIDVRGTLVVGDVIRTRMAVQVKRWKNKVQSPIVQQVRGSLGSHEQGLIVTTGGFAKGAVEEAKQSDKTPIALMDGAQLVQLLIENDIGVQRTTYNLLALNDDNGS